MRTAQCGQWLVNESALDQRRCVFGFPHPSGANVRRGAQFRANAPALQRMIKGWSRRPACNARYPASAMTQVQPIKPKPRSRDPTLAPTSGDPRSQAKTATAHGQSLPSSRHHPAHDSLGDEPHVG